MATRATTWHLPQPPPKTTGGKRGAPGPIPSMNSSDEEDGDSVSLPSPRREPPPVSPSISNYACEHDHDYENVASPNSSTASGPVYVRPPGFKHHAHEIVAKSRFKKKKTAALITLRDGLKKREQTPPKVKVRKDPLPMRLRALPQSFWEQPNVPHQVSPGNIFPILPPLWNKDTEDDVSEMRPVTPPEDREEPEANKKPPRPPERKISLANTDLLFRLFDGVQGEQKKVDVHRLKRGRPKKCLQKTASGTKGLLSGNDPYLVDAMSEKLFPQLSLENGRSGNTSLQLITVRGDGDKTVTLPALGSDQNYSQMLSELVMHI